MSAAKGTIRKAQVGSFTLRVTEQCDQLKQAINKMFPKVRKFF